MINTITTGDARELSRAIPDESIDLIFTDPPYDRASLPLYDWLAREADRTLKPGGFLLTYAGSIWKDQVMARLGEHLTFFWDYIVIYLDHSTLIHPTKTMNTCRSILAYVKGQGKPNNWVRGHIISSGSDKRFHEWGQNGKVMAYYLERFSQPGDIIFEPFTGGGTIPALCAQLNRNFIAFEVNPATADIARKRLETVQPLLMPEQARQLPLESEVPA